MILTKKAFFIFLCFSLFLPLSAETQNSPDWTILWGTDTGLYRQDRRGTVAILWSGARVKSILQMGSGWAILTDEGIWVSENLRNWEQRSKGLPEKVIKIYEGRAKSFVSTVQEIKDFAIDPANPELMVCAVKDAVYLSRDGGLKWESLGMPS